MRLRRAAKGGCKYTAKRVLVGAFVMYAATLVFLGGCVAELFVRDEPHAS